MFTGIIEAFGKVESIQKEGTNVHFTISSDIWDQLKIDESVAHNGVCLTVTDTADGKYMVTAIDETLKKTNLGELQVGDLINLERAMKWNGRLDGHLVQGHVDQVAECISVSEEDGSHIFRFDYGSSQFKNVEKGSICINGVSLTLVDVEGSRFSVAIIPYTFEHTNFNQIVAGTMVNLEFDIIGKYVAKMFEAYK